MFESILKFFKKPTKKEEKTTATNSKSAAKERLHLVLMQDRANVSADFLELMKQEIIDVIKKYIDVDEEAIDVRLTNQTKDDGTNGAPALYANIPIMNIKNESRKMEAPKTETKNEKKDSKKEEKIEAIKENKKEEQVKVDETERKVDVVEQAKEVIETAETEKIEEKDAQNSQKLEEKKDVESEEN